MIDKRPADRNGPSARPEWDAMLRKLDRPYRPGLMPWIAGLALIGLICAALIAYVLMQPPALDPEQPPPLPPLGPDAGRVYLIEPPAEPDR